MTPPPPPPSPSPDPAARCVLLVGGGAVPSNLVAALDQRGIRAVIARAAPEVMAELAGGGVASVVVVEPERQDRARELHAAAAVYHPDVRFWAYAPQAPGREAKLSVFAARSPADASQTDGSPASGSLESGENAGTQAKPWYPPVTGGQETPSPATRAPDSITGHHPDAGTTLYPPTGPHRAADTAEDDQRLVTEQELAMLLGTDSMPPPGTVPGRVTGSIRGHGRENGRE